MSRRKVALRRKLTSQQKWKLVRDKNGGWTPQPTGERDVTRFLPANLGLRKRALWLAWSK